MSLLKHIRLLPVLVLVAGLSFTIRVGDFISGFEQMGTAYAQHETSVDVPPLPTTGLEIEEDKKTKENGEVSLGLDDGQLASEGKALEWSDAGDSEFEFSAAQEGLYKDLAKRHGELEQQQKALMTREALLKAGERELEQKLRELIAVRNEIEGLLREQSEEEKARIISLVKIYEGMKAKDAARIFNTLDIDVLIMVMSRMSERKSAPVLAEMNPERARTVTILLARQKRLPSLSSQ